MSRKSYINASKMVKMCRICLTQSNNLMYDLADVLTLTDSSEICILDALEKVVSKKVLLNEVFPQCICPMCISILKMSFQFVSHFDESQRELRNMFGKSPTYFPIEHIEQAVTEETPLRNDEVKEEAPVEIIVGESKFNLKDVFVVEEAPKNNCNFNGFLKNLGREVSASFADHSKKPVDKKCEDAVSIFMTDTENGILPVKELKIDNDTNTIDYIVVEESDKNDSQVDSGDKVEYIEIEAPNGEVESLIIEMTGTEEDEVNKENTVDAPRAENVIKVGKKRKLIRERKLHDMIIMEPISGDEANNEDDEDIFEKEVQLACEVCKKVFPTMRSLKAHKKRTHFSKQRIYTCETCGYQNNTRSGYVHHKVKHQGKNFMCEICKKTYYTRAVLKVHMASHVNKRQHLCSVCGKGFNYANALLYHMRLHTGERNYKCDYCGKKFRMPNALKRHVRTHTGERPYRCQFCDVGFCSRGEVQCHETIHTGYKPYHCKHCRKGFTKTHNLKLHLLSHDGPHRCDVCGRSFIEMAILSMHYKIAHKDLVEANAEDAALEDSGDV